MNTSLRRMKQWVLLGCALAAAGLLGGCNEAAQAVNGAMDIDLSTLPVEIVDPVNWSDDPEAIYLVAQLPEDDIYLYGYGDKQRVLLRQGEQRALLDWDYITPRLILPEMRYADFDNDGSKELAVVLYNASGTGVSVEELHIVSWQGTEAVDRLYEQEDYQKQLSEQVSWRYDGDNHKATLRCGYLDVYLTDGMEEDYSQYQGIADFGSQVAFDFTQDGRIKASFALGLIKEGKVEPDYIGRITAQVLYSKGKLSMDPNTMLYVEE